MDQGLVLASFCVHTTVCFTSAQFILILHVLHFKLLSDIFEERLYVGITVSTALHRKKGIGLGLGVRNLKSK